MVLNSHVMIKLEFHVPENWFLATRNLLNLYLYQHTRFPLFDKIVVARLMTAVSFILATCLEAVFQEIIIGESWKKDKLFSFKAEKISLFYVMNQCR